MRIVYENKHPKDGETWGKIQGKEHYYYYTFKNGKIDPVRGEMHSGYASILKEDENFSKVELYEIYLTSSPKEFSTYELTNLLHYFK